MNVIWQYLDKRGAAISALKDYSIMEFIIDHTDEEIAKEYSAMEGIHSPQYGDHPHNQNPKPTDVKIIESIEEIDVLKERYRQAVEYMDWFKPAWQKLSADEQYVLETFYHEDEDSQTMAVYTICEQYNIEKTSAYKKKNRALTKLTGLLFGKG